MMRKMHCRHFVLATTLSLAALALALSAPANVALAQQTPNKPQVRLSELRPIVEQYVKDLSQISKEQTGVEISPEEKRQMVEDTIFKMKAEGFYAYVDP